MYLPLQENSVTFAPNYPVWFVLCYSLLYLSSSFCHIAPICNILGGIIFSYAGLLYSRYVVCIFTYTQHVIIQLKNPSVPNVFRMAINIFIVFSYLLLFLWGFIQILKSCFVKCYIAVGGQIGGFSSWTYTACIFLVWICRCLFFKMIFPLFLCLNDLFD